MTMGTPIRADAFIEEQLTSRLRAIERLFDADCMAYIGGLVFGVDDAFRDVIEKRRSQDSNRNSLAFILTTGGGYIEVVQRIAETLRYHYETVEFIIPNRAFSAGTVLAMSGDAIHMDYYSRLGPIDPQVESLNGESVPALGYLMKWEQLLQKAQNGSLTIAEANLMIEGFDQAELYMYEQARELTITLLKEWLVQYKFKNWTVTRTNKSPVTDEMKQDRANQIARQLNDTDRWHSHGYGISMDILDKELNLVIDDFGAEEERNEAIKTYYGLLEDYVNRTGRNMVLHIPDEYLVLN